MTSTGEVDSERLARRPRIVLASASPRRRELLALLGVPFEVSPSRFDEPDPRGCPVAVAAFVKDLAIGKALEVASRIPADIVIGADTTVTTSELEMGILLSKPIDTADATHMLKQLAGRAHYVYTGVAIVSATEGLVETAVVRTKVEFREMTDAQIDAYVESGEPFDKAGGYGAQGKAAPYISAIHGDFYNVVGLPICTVAQMLERRGARP